MPIIGIIISSIVLGAALVPAASAANQAPDAGADAGFAADSYRPVAKEAALIGSSGTENTVTQNKTDTRSSSRQAKLADGPPARPDLSGSWRLNREMSDDPRKKIQEAMQRVRSANRGKGAGRGGMGRGGQRGGGMGGRPSGARTGGRDRGRPERESTFQELKALLNGSETLELTHKEPMLLIVTDGGKRQRVFTDMRGGSVSAMGSMDQSVTIAGWEQDILIIETTNDPHPRLVQEFKLDANTHRLLVSTVVRLPWSSETVSINRVYEAADVQTNADKNAALLPGD